MLSSGNTSAAIVITGYGPVEHVLATAPPPPPIPPWSISLAPRAGMPAVVLAALAACYYYAPAAP
eukprot:3926016-Pyramimonas_sp.AAC.1